MKFKQILLPTALLIASAGAAQAQLNISISPVNPTVHQGDTVTFTATVTNLTGGTIFPGFLFFNGALNQIVDFPFAQSGLHVVADSVIEIANSQPD